MGVQGARLVAADVVVDGEAGNDEGGADLEEELLGVVVLDRAVDRARVVGYGREDRVDLGVRVGDAYLVEKLIHCLSSIAPLGPRCKEPGGIVRTSAGAPGSPHAGSLSGANLVYYVL